ncbi:hypothetical protein ACSQOK_000456 [Klebsiella aerogenes]
MTKSTITRERAEQLANFKGAPVTRQEEQELARIALAAMDSEPVAYAWVSRSGKKHLTRCEPEQWRDAVIVTPLYRHAQPAPELAAIVERLNLSGYEYEGGEVTPQNAAAIVDTLLQQLDDAVQGRNAQPAPVVPEEMPKGLAGQIVSLLAHNIGDKFLAQKIWNACRSTMLSGGES